MRYLDDLRVGERIESNETYELREEDIVTFCSRWDPLPFHVDAAAAAATPVGALFTSALHTLCIGSHLIHRVKNEPVAIVVGLGWDAVRFLAPAVVGDVLRATCETIEVRPSESKPDRGVVRYRIEVRNQRDAVVVSFESAILVMRRPSAG